MIYLKSGEQFVRWHSSYEEPGRCRGHLFRIKNSPTAISASPTSAVSQHDGISAEMRNPAPKDKTASPMWKNRLHI